MRALQLASLALPLALALAACSTAKSVGSDTGSSGTGSTGGTGGTGGGSTGIDTSADPWCNVQAIIATQCVVCHSAASALGSLDLETSPWDALVGMSSALYAGRTLVVPGDSASSFLVTKIEGSQAADEGTIMPSTGAMSDVQISEFHSWIDAGAAAPDCGTIGTTGSGSGVHPAGYADPAVHGIDAKMAVTTCTDCHGTDLSGSGDAVSCDTCHQADWRTTCTYCHGGLDNETGAPPEDIDDSTSDATFGSHTAHVEAASNYSAYDCSDCHQVPTDVLSSGHLWDGTAGVAEVDMSGSISSSGTWSNAAMSCGNTYCHSNGQSLSSGSVSASGGSTTCHSCHGDQTSGASSLSGRHADHLEESLSCSDCHADVASGSTSIVSTSLHINGSVEWAPGDSTMWIGSDGSCTGFCHYEGHWYETW